MMQIMIKPKPGTRLDELRDLKLAAIELGLTWTVTAAGDMLAYDPDSVPTRQEWPALTVRQDQLVDLTRCAASPAVQGGEG